MGPKKIEVQLLTSKFLNNNSKYRWCYAQLFLKTMDVVYFMLVVLTKCQLNLPRSKEKVDLFTRRKNTVDINFLEWSTAAFQTAKA